MRDRAVLAAALALGLAACGGGDGAPPTAEQGASDAACGADAAQDLVGQPLDDLAAASFTAEVTRFINPDDVVTTDFRPERMNIELDGSGEVVRVYCG